MSSVKLENITVPYDGSYCGGGCGGKVPAETLRNLLDDENFNPISAAGGSFLLHARGEDAAITRMPWSIIPFRIGRVALHTTDFGSPIVPNAMLWGKIAALSAMSDIWAMGGEVETALNLLSFPADIPENLNVARAILAGGKLAVEEAGGKIVGGHTTDGDFKYGLSLSGTTQRRKLMLKSAGKPGMDLILTKPLGTGIGAADAIDGLDAFPRVTRAAIDTMLQSNQLASKIAVEYGVRAGTDVTGFGFIGHLREIAQRSGCAAEVSMYGVPRLANIDDVIKNGRKTKAGIKNHVDANRNTRWNGCPLWKQTLFTGVENNGGLLFAAFDGRTLAQELYLFGYRFARVVGRLAAGEAGSITIVN
jgi:selenide,water dikinase